MLSSQSIPSFTTSDFEELSNIYALEYNKPELHDRVLILDVLKDEYEPNQIPVSLIGDEEEGNTRSPDSPDSESTDKESTQSPFEAGKLTTEGEADVPSVEALTEAETLSDFSNSDLPRQHEIFVHSSWLAVHSSYFRSLFYSGLSESHLKEVHLKITECEEKGHLLLLEAMYKLDILNEACSVDDLLVVLELADKYQVKFVFRKCKYVLKAKATTIEDCKKIVQVVKVKQNMTDVEDLIDTITAFLVQTFSPLDETWQRESFVNLSEVLVSYLLSSDDLTTQSENTVFHALMHWIEFNELDKSSEDLNALPLLSVVRFEFLTMDYLNCVAQHHPIATKMLHFIDVFLKGVIYHGLQEDAKKRLKVKPVERKTAVNDIVQYRWTVLSSEIASLTQTTDTELTSDVFWSCGYQMKMTVRSIHEHSTNLSIRLHVLDLVQESFVPIRYKFKYVDRYNRQKESRSHFSLDSQMSFEITLERTKGAEQPLNIDLIIKPVENY